jgi:hypothetical protein
VAQEQPMTSEVQSLSPQSGRTHPPRKLRNYLLEPKFQLKYTGMVVGVTLVVAAVLGFQVYDYSTGQTRLLNLERMGSAAAADAQFIADMERYALEADRKVALAVLGGIGLLALALAFTGIIVTHRLVGPAYRLRQLLRQVSEGRLRPAGSLRKHDELRDVFEMFQRMTGSLRSAREQDLADIERAFELARAAGTSDSVLAPLREIEARIRKTLE